MSKIDHAAELEAIDGWRAGDRVAGARLVAMHRDTIAAIARRYVCARVELQDLVQVGSIALLKAASSPTFDPRIANFATYAGWAIARKAVAYRRRTSADLSAGDETHSLLADVQQAKPGATDRGDQKALARLRQSALRLDAPAHSDADASLLDTVHGSHRPADEVLDACRRRALLAELVAGLDDEEREIIQRRYLTDEPESQEAIGRSFGFSGANVWAIETAALARLRKRAAWITRSIC